ncbi:hypothetical protein SAMN05216420_10648 [Nitrosospira sp. Nl5]|uniref:hypothetical protein n=1 Tax=Nitrosospira sp. Nl5 TaxID=200120 RepID=UPI00087EFD0D|nr:hypothetical protein [Nitrosospira sp. Nl5]SCY42703.1 hypothetical protein SAMN05216420_10648 [Nitrosospira sp. Nl5]
MLNNLYGKWKSRTRYPSYADMPTPLVSFFAACGFLVSGFDAYVLAGTMPLYLEEANSIPLGSWGLKGWLLTVLLALLGLRMWFFGSLALRCNSILRDRLFK